MTQVDVLPVERRRRWSRSEKERLVASSFEPGVSASEVARSAGIHVSQLFRWRKQLCERTVPPAPALIPVAVVSDEPAPTETAPVRSRRRTGLIEIGLSGGRRVRVDRDVDAEALRRVLDALGER
jgi:transposase